MLSMFEILRASMRHSKEEGYVGQVAFRVEGHPLPYEITLYSTNRKEWGYGLHFLDESGSEEHISAVEEMLEDDEWFDQLVDAANASA